MIFWKAVKAYNEADLHDALDEMEKSKRSRGRPRKQIQDASTSSSHTTPAVPSRIGRRGRVIPGRGVSRGGNKVVRGGRGRGRGHLPVGYGVIVDEEGHTWTNVRKTITLYINYVTITYMCLD
ncbi:unnamed protein product [Cuscuta europaea]|uniref:Uncharacterized protein n=1 Tax=Cuscuta europaea TaxID=41803 RepID=A0A9P0YY18_CUSEU|nr:unnamed protein product [Cuscuta europaea]